MFDNYKGKTDTPFLTRSEFRDMVFTLIYEMTFLSYFNEPTFDGEPFSGHVTDAKDQDPTFKPNLLAKPEAITIQHPPLFDKP